MKRILSFLLCMTVLVMFSYAQKVLVKEDFESYNAGAKFVKAAQNAGKTHWRTWTGSLSATEDASVSTEQAQEGSQSMKVVFGNDIVMLLDNKYSGKYDLSFYILVPEGKDAYYNILQDFNGTDSKWKTECYMNHKLHMNSICIDGVERNFEYKAGTWAHMHYIIDLDEDNVIFEYNDKKFASWKWSTQSDGLAGLSQIAAIDFYAPTSKDTSVFYIDNITFTELREPGAPLFTAFPGSVKQTLIVGEKANQILSLNNVGTYKGDWAYNIKYELSKADDTISVAELKYDFNHPASLPFGKKSIGWNVSNPVWEIGHKFTVNMYNDKALGMYLTKGRFYNKIPVLDSTITFRVYAQGGDNAPGELLSEVVVTDVPDSAWVEGVFPDSVLLTGEDVWVTASFQQTKKETYPVTCDYGPMLENSSYALVDGRGWYRPTQLNPELNYNFVVRAECSGYFINGSWLSVGKPLKGTLNRKSIQEIELAFDASTMKPGTYHADITFTTNDSIGTITVPVELTVLADSGCLPPANFAVKTMDNNIELSWTAKDSAAMYKIYRNNVLLDSTSNTSYIDSVLANGNYCYHITTICEEESAPTSEICAYINLGVKDYNQNIEIYPNPAYDVINVSAVNFNEAVIYNMMGQEIYRQSITDNNFQINISKIPAGVYFLHLNGETSAIKKFIKQ